jgi:hypothetical protein
MALLFAEKRRVERKKKGMSGQLEDFKGSLDKVIHCPWPLWMHGPLYAAPTHLISIVTPARRCVMCWLCIHMTW